VHRIEIRCVDITTVDADVIINAANEQLMPGGGVCGAIHRAAGPELEEACRTIGRCPPGSARVTRGYRLGARSVVHAVGPRWSGGSAGEDELLARAYTDAIHLAADHGARIVACPAISCGNYGYPVERAARIAIRSVWRALNAAPTIERVIFCVIEPEVHQAFRRARDDEQVQMLAGRH
jgi:O-acetyl-ADP-ribose deacetylase (regulator of RNase III)